MKVSLVCGHNLEEMGAINSDGMTEFYFYNLVIMDVINLNKNKNIIIEGFIRQSNKLSIRDNIIQATKLKPNICIELHFNAFDKKAHGCEALWINKENELAESILELWSKEHNSRNRGIKVVAEKDHGFSSVNEIHNQNIKGFLFEPFFGDNKLDNKKPREVAIFLIKWLNEVYNDEKYYAQ